MRLHSRRKLQSPWWQPYKSTSRPKSDWPRPSDMDCFTFHTKFFPCPCWYCTIIRTYFACLREANCHTFAHQVSFLLCAFFKNPSANRKHFVEEPCTLNKEFYLRQKFTTRDKIESSGSEDDLKMTQLLIKELWNHPDHFRCVSGCQCRSLIENTVRFTGISHSNKITNFHEQRLKVLAGPHTPRIRTECEKRSYAAQIYF